MKSYLSDEQVFDILRLYGSPVYVYDAQTIEQRCTTLANFAKKLSAATRRQVRMHYSTKSNSNLEILRLIRSCGIYADCMSPVELMLDMRAGFTQGELLYVCNNISAEEMALVHETGISICLDSISQVENWARKFHGSEIVVRINPGTIGVGHSEKVITSGHDTKFGISEENLPELFQLADVYNLKIVGVHQHLGSLFLNDKIDNYMAGVSALLGIIKRNAEGFKDLRILDLGGGFGVPYKTTEQPLDFDILFDKLAYTLKSFVTEFPSITEVKFEPGRFIPCEAGLLLGTVTSVKTEYGTTWVGTDVGMGMLVRPSMYGSYHEIEVVQREPSDQTVDANICGNVCESGDILGKSRTVKAAEVNDAVIVHNAGAYGYSMASNYTGRLLPAEVMVKRDRLIPIRRAQTLDDILSFYS